MTRVRHYQITLTAVIDDQDKVIELRPVLPGELETVREGVRDLIEDGFQLQEEKSSLLCGKRA